MLQRIATTRLPGGTEIAYALAGESPFLVRAPRWLTHLERSGSTCSARPLVLLSPSAGRPNIRTASHGWCCTAALTLYQRAAASPETARSLLALCYRVDVAAALSHIHAPTLVIHRDRDRAAPVAQGRLLAQGIPGASFELLTGRSHLPYIGDVDALARLVRRFLGLSALRRRAAPTLTARQREVAALVTDGRTNREIGMELRITERSVESHVERIGTRMGFRSRAQIAAWYVGSGGRS